MPVSILRQMLTTSRALLGLCLLAIAACGGGEGPAGSSAKTGTLTITLAGLPSGAVTAVTVSGPNAFSRTVTATETLSNVPVGAYTIAATEALAGNDRFAATISQATVTVSRGATASATVSYTIATGSIAVTLMGLPAGAPASLTLSGAAGFSRSLNRASTVGGLTPGSYTVTALAVAADGHTYAPTAVEWAVTVAASVTPTNVEIPYRVATGAITALLEGLPTGQNPAISITGPNNFTRTVAAGETVTNLIPGAYQLTAQSLTVGVDQYRVSANTVVTVQASLTPVLATVQYAIMTGRLAVSFSGLPQGISGSASIAGPSGFARNVTTSEVVTGLVPGEYVVTPSDVVNANVTYGVSSGAKTVTVTPSTVPADASFSYAITRGSISLVINGLPQAIPAAVTVRGPNNFATNVATTGVLAGLLPGTYTITATNTLAGVHVYAGVPGTAQVTVSASPTPVAATVTYSLASGLLSLTVNGLPPNVPANIVMTGPGGFSRNITATSLLTGLTPGIYTVAADVAQNGASFWAPNPASQNITIPASTSAVQAAVTYQTANGSLVVNISGLPANVNADVRLTGPNNYAQTVTQTTTLNGLLQGIYTVTSNNVTNTGSTYTAAPVTQPASVGGGVTSSVNVTYTQTGGPPPPPAPLNLTIDGMHVQQVVQTYAGTVPLVAGKSGLLRVFAKANTSNSAAPTVRVRLYDGATLINTLTITAPGSSVPTTVSQGSLSNSWNVLIPSGQMIPTLKILADVDPTNAITESSDGDNTFPASGTPLAMDVRTLPALDVRFVPVTQNVNGLTGAVTGGNVGSYFSYSAKVFPINTTNIDVRAAYTTSAPVLQSNDGNGAWSQILSELNALRAADGSTKYYAGIAKVTYGSGIAGLGYLPGRATLSWDYLPSASEVVAHELGHNFGRAHAPCGGAGGPDPSYPYAGGVIGQYGYDIGASALKAPTLTDFMGYCNSNWISDYTYVAVMNYRIANPFIALGKAAMAAGPRPGLLVWGRVRNGQVILEPAFEVNAVPSLPTQSGPNRLRAFGPLGEQLLDLPFAGEVVRDHPDATAQHFAFVIPLDMIGGQAPTRITVSALGRTAERRSGGTAMATRMVGSVEREGARGVRVRWSDPEIQGVMVRDARTGEILSFGRAGEARVASSTDEVVLTLSDGVRSASRRQRVAPERR